MMQFLIIFLVCAVGSLARSFHPKIPKIPSNAQADVDRKIIFTEYIKSNRIEQARELSQVSLGLSIISYAGFFTVNETCGSNLFFWFFPSQNDPSKDPVSIWLNGGPGLPSFTGAFTPGLGPYEYKSDGTMGLQTFTWTRHSSIIFIDNPVGTGFSYTEDESCYATDQTQVGRDILNALKQFFQVFPEYKENDFFVTGLSYAGHYVPAVGYAIHNDPHSGVNLKGLAIGNGWVDPESQLVYSENLFQLGLVDAKTRNLLAALEEATKAAIRAKDFEFATDLRTILLDKIGSFGFSFQNYLEGGIQSRDEQFERLVKATSFLEAIHVGNATWHGFPNNAVANALKADRAMSYRPWLQILMDHYKVLIYNGQLDVIDSYATTAAYLPLLQWKDAGEYANAKRKKWYVNGDLAGYVKSAGNFSEVLVRNAGHTVFTEKPEWALELYNKFIFNQPIA